MVRKFFPEPEHDLDDLVENVHASRPLAAVRRSFDALLAAVDDLLRDGEDATVGADTLILPPDSTERAALVAAAFCAPDTTPEDDPDDMDREYSCSCGYLVANCRYGTWQCKQDDGKDEQDEPLPFDATADEDKLP